MNICLTGLALAALASAQSLGTVPAPTFDVPDLYNAFHLPALKDTPQGGLDSVLSSTQAGMRAATLRLTGQSPLDAWAAAAKLLRRSRTARTPAALKPVTFAGSTASALNQVIAAGTNWVTVTAATLNLDQPIALQRNGITLNVGAAVLTSAGAQPYLLRIEGAAGVTVTGGEFISGNSAILINNSSGVRVENVAIHGLSADGLVVTGSTNVYLSRNRIHGLSGAPIVLHRGTTSSVVEQNEISSNLGPSNITAGIVRTDREVDLSAKPGALFGPDGYWVVSQPIPGRLHPPHDNLIAFNHIAGNASSGVYVDGGIRKMIVSNTIEGNAKEGLCLDNGSAANVIASNVIQHNGSRWGESDWVLAEDSVLAGGRLADGTAAEKVPGISIDNVLYNIVFANNVAHNSGGGIKMVRTGYFNLIGLNTVFSDNDGASAAFHFFGIEMGAAPGDSTSIELHSLLRDLLRCGIGPEPSLGEYDPGRPGLGARIGCRDGEQHTQQSDRPPIAQYWVGPGSRAAHHRPAGDGSRSAVIWATLAHFKNASLTF